MVVRQPKKGFDHEPQINLGPGEENPMHNPVTIPNINHEVHVTSVNRVVTLPQRHPTLSLSAMMRGCFMFPE